MAAKYWARANGERADEWREVFGSDVVPVVGPNPELVRLPIGAQPCFFLDLERVDDATVLRAVEHIAGRFAVGVDEVAEELPQGLPLLAAGLYVFPGSV